MFANRHDLVPKNDENKKSESGHWREEKMFDGLQATDIHSLQTFIKYYTSVKFEDFSTKKYIYKNIATGDVFSWPRPFVVALRQLRQVTFLYGNVSLL